MKHLYDSFTGPGQKPFSFFLMNLFIGLWLMGVILGIRYALFHSALLEEFFMYALPASMNLAGGIISLIPLVISVLCEWICFRPGIYLLGFVYGFFWGLGFCSLYACFNTGGMLAVMLACFSRLMIFPVVFWFGIRRIIYHHNYFFNDCILCFLIGLLISLLDFAFIAPTVRNIFS